MRRMLGRRVVERHVLDRVGGADDLGWAVLPLRRPHRQARQEPAVWLLELAQGVGDVASVLSLMSLPMHTCMKTRTCSFWLVGVSGLTS